VEQDAGSYPTAITFHVAAAAEEMPRHRFGPTALVFSYWLSKAAGRAAPTRPDIDPAEIPPALGYIVLWDVLENGARVICRLAGTSLCELAGRELRGRTVEEIHWDRPGAAKLEFQRVVSTLEPDYVERALEWTNTRVYRPYGRLLLPLVGPTERAPAAMLLSIVDFL